SDEVATLLAYLSLEPHVPTGGNARSPISEARESAAAWLAKTEPSDTTQAAALRMLVGARTGRGIKALGREIDAFMGRQNADGGWGQRRELSSDAYATGQALYFLSL